MGITVALLGVLYACVTAVFAGQGQVLEAQANSFLPYVVAPFACGAALAERRPQLAAVTGASIAVAMVVGFYGATEATSAFPLHSWGIKFWVAQHFPWAPAQPSPEGPVLHGLLGRGHCE